MDESFSLKNKNAIVVGGSGDLGKSIVKGYLSKGAKVVVLDINDGIEEFLKELNLNKKKFKFIQIDLSDDNEIELRFKEALHFLDGPLHILVNSAGIQIRHQSNEFPNKDWDKVIRVNLTAAFQISKLAANEMLKEHYGKIINIASMQSFLGGITIPAYAASKGGIAQLTKAFSNDLAGKGINVNAIAPGYMDTKLNTAIRNDPLREKEILSRIPKGRWGTGEDLAGLAIFLASAESDYISGTVIPVDGGFLAR
jgi:2-deoxy-D-gluconate 3-dehydrogenase